MSAAELAALVARVENGDPTPAERAAYAAEIVGDAGIDGYSLTTVRETAGVAA